MTYTLTKNNSNHAVAEDNGRRLHCRRCNQSYTVNLPCPLTVYAGILKEFAAIHAHCADKNSSTAAANEGGTVGLPTGEVGSKPRRDCGDDAQGGCRNDAQGRCQL